MIKVRVESLCDRGHDEFEVGATQSDDATMILTFDEVSFALTDYDAAMLISALENFQVY